MYTILKIAFLSALAEGAANYATKETGDNYNFFHTSFFEFVLNWFQSTAGPGPAGCTGVSYSAESAAHWRSLGLDIPDSEVYDDGNGISTRGTPIITPIWNNEPTTGRDGTRRYNINYFMEGMSNSQGTKALFLYHGSTDIF